jgi:GT2 family glycosyltransferase
MSHVTDAGPDVSVIVRTRNRPEMLAGALSDIARQDFQDFEIVLVDDGDDHEETLKVVARSGDVAQRVRLVDRSHEAHGRARAANAGLRAAHGRLLTLHDDDDSWHPTFLAATVAFLNEHPDSVAISAHTEVVIHRGDADSGEVHEQRLLLNPSLHAITIPDMLRANRVTTNSLVYRASLHDEIGYIDEDLVVHEDWDFYLRLIAKHPIDLLPLPALAYWHHRPDATGDQANSVFALSDAHDNAHAQVRDNHLRATIASHGWGPAFLLTEGLQRLEETVAREQATATDAFSTRLDAVERRLVDLAASAARHEAALAELKALLLERTSISSVFRRLRRRGR